MNDPRRIGVQLHPTVELCACSVDAAELHFRLWCPCGAYTHALDADARPASARVTCSGCRVQWWVQRFVTRLGSGQMAAVRPPGPRGGGVVGGGGEAA